MKSKAKILVGVISLVAIIAIIVPWVLRYSDGRKVEERQIKQTISITFSQQHNSDAKILDIVKPQREYIVLWEDTTSRHASLWIDGIWVEVARVPLNSQTPQEVK